MQSIVSAEVVPDAAPTRLVLALRQELVLEAVGQLLRTAGFDVVGRCVRAGDLERCLRAQAPDLALVDTEMAGDGGVALVRAASRGLVGGRLVLLAPQAAPPSPATPSRCRSTG